MSLTLLVPPSVDRPTPHRATAPTPLRHTCSTLAGRLNREWGQLGEVPTTAAALSRWASACPRLADVRTLDDVLAVIAATDEAGRDAVLLTLLELAQSGEALAGRTVLQAMLGRAVRVAATVARRDDVRGDREEALATAVAALWQAIATYPVSARRSRVAANLAMDTVAWAQRGHTGSSHFRRTYREVPVADVRSVSETAHHDGGPDELRGPADAELMALLAWAVRSQVLDLDEARLLLRVYSVDGNGRPADVRTVAEQEGLAWPTLRQRCRRLARRVGTAAVAAGVKGADHRSPGSVLVIA